MICSSQPPVLFVMIIVPNHRDVSLVIIIGSSLVILIEKSLELVVGVMTQNGYLLYAFVFTINFEQIFKGGIEAYLGRYQTQKPKSLNV